MSSTEIAPNGNAADGPSRSQRGVVEEVISKRLKALTKKIIRIKAYGAQPAQSLNADQKSAMASLPSLEAVARELEDLIEPGGPVETAELSQAGILRETRDSASAQAIAIAQAQLESYSETISKRLSQFLRLHSLLHPARASDHQHLVNGDLNLPSHLREQVTPSDILRVGRMYDDLNSGGEAGKKILQQLGGSPDLLETEDAHVLELLDLIDQPQISVPPSEAGAGDGIVDPLAQPQFGSAGGLEPTEVDEIQPETEVEDQNRTRQPTDYSVQTRTSGNGLPLGASASQVGGGIATDASEIAGPTAPPALNFLQEDELIERPVDPIESVSEPVIAEPPSAEQSYTPPAPVVKQDAPNPTLAPPITSTSASPKIDWAADDDDDEEPIFSTRATSLVQVAPTPPIQEVTLTQDKADEPDQIALVQEADTQPSSTSTAVDVPTTVESSLPAKPVQANTSRGSGSRRGRGRGGGGGSKAQTQNRPSLPQQASSQRKVIDDDGFEQVSKKQAQPQSQGQGRGGANWGKGDGRGRGSGTGAAAGAGQRNRGRGLPRNPSQGASTPNGTSGGGKPKSAESKPLYKSDVVGGTK